MMIMDVYHATSLICELRIKLLGEIDVIYERAMLSYTNDVTSQIYFSLCQQNESFFMSIEDLINEDIRHDSD